MEQGAVLKAVHKRVLSITGEYELSLDRLSIVLPKFSVVAEKGKKSKKLEADDYVLLVADTTVAVKGRVVSVKPNPELYRLGTLSGPMMFDETDGPVQLVFRFTAEDDCDLNKLGYFCKLYIHSKGA